MASSYRKQVANGGSFLIRRSLDAQDTEPANRAASRAAPPNAWVARLKPRGPRRRPSRDTVVSNLATY